MAFNLHAIAAPFTAIITGATSAIWQQSTGYTVTPDGTRSPAYAVTPDFDIRVQALEGDELTQVDSLNIQGIKRAVYCNGHVSAIDRKDQSGGDLLTFNGATWLVILVLEDWDASGWCKVAVAKQLDAGS